MVSALPPSPYTSLLLLILARTAAPSGRTYFAPIPGENCSSLAQNNKICFKPNVVAAEAELHPRETPVSRAGETLNISCRTISKQSAQLHLLVDGSTEIGSIDHAGVEDKVLSGVADAEVVLGNCGLGQVKAGLVASQPALVADHSGGVDGGEAEVHVGSHSGRLVLVFSLQLARL